MKVLIAVILVALLAGVTGCATKNDKDMYGSYTKAVTTVSSDKLTYFSKQLTILAQSIPIATTPLERHLIRQSIMDLHFEIQSVQRATGTNDVLAVIAKKSDDLLRTSLGAAVLWKGIDVAGDVLADTGVSADNGAVVNLDRNEEHTTAVGEGASSLSKADPIVVEVPIEEQL